MLRGKSFVIFQSAFFKRVHVEFLEDFIAVALILHHGMRYFHGSPPCFVSNGESFIWYCLHARSLKRAFRDIASFKSLTAGL